MVKQIGYVVADLEAAMKEWTTALGVGPFHYMERVAITNYRYGRRRRAPWISVALAFSGSLQIELIQQRDDTPSIWRDGQARPGAPHHIAFWTTSFDATLRRLLSQGFTIITSGRSGDGSPDEGFAYLAHPTAGTGIIEVSGNSGAKAAMHRMIAEAASGWDGSDPVRRLTAPASAPGQLGKD